jgi:hypothetical protein
MSSSLKGRLELGSCLSDKEHVKVYLATGADGRRVVVKFIESSRRFFDELGRFYALDDVECVCELLAHFPPASAGGEAFLTNGQGRRWLVDFDEETGRSLVEGEIGFSDLNDVGALVFEWIDGPRLIDYLNFGGPLEKLQKLIELARELENIHARGEFHGGLTTENVRVHRESQRIRLIDLGFFPGKDPYSDVLSPEHTADHPEHVGAASDVYMFANNFLAAVDLDSSRMRKLVRNCLDFQPSARPEMSKVVQGLVRVREEYASRAMNRWVRPEYLRAAAILWACVFSTLAITHFYASPSREIADEYINQSDVLEEGLILLHEQRVGAWHEERVLIDIALQINRLNQHNGVVVPKFEQQDLKTPDLVLAFEKQPIVYKDGQFARIGDQLVTEAGVALIYHITTTHIRYRLRNGDVDKLFFTKPAFDRYLEDQNIAIVWPRKNNLAELVDDLALIAEYYRDQLPEADHNPLFGLTRGSGYPVAHVEGDVLGTFFAGDLPAFLDALSSHLVFQSTTDGLHVSVDRANPPIFNIIGMFFSQDNDLKNFSRTFGSWLSIPVEAEEAIQGERLPDGMFRINADWRRLCQDLGLSWEFVWTDDNAPVLRLLDYNPPAGEWVKEHALAR